MEKLFAILTTHKTDFALEAAYIQSMILIPEVTPIPEADSSVRGVINHGGVVIPLVDLRLRLGLPPRRAETEEFLSMIDAREDDHRKWLGELELSIAERREFKLQRDPHQCAFGKWYDQYKPDHPVVSQILSGFDVPHKRIHGLAGEVETLVRAGDKKSADLLLKECRENEFKSLIKLFDRLKTAYRKIMREVVVIVAAGGRTFGLAVDRIRTVAQFDDKSISGTDRLNLNLPEHYPVTGIAREENSDQMILVLDPSALLN